MFVDEVCRFAVVLGRAGLVTASCRDYPAARLHHLSTFLGHVSPDTTAVYLTITSDLFAEANRRFEALAVPMIGEVRP
jgi:hypothetical protein